MRLRNALMCAPVIILAAVTLLGCSNEGSNPGTETDTGRDTNRDTHSDAVDDSVRDTDTDTGTDADTDVDTDTDAETSHTLSSQYPQDLNIENDPAVLFHDDFETGWGRWDAPLSDTPYLTMRNGDTAHAGTGYLQSLVTAADLEATEYISSSSRVAFARQEEIFWRFYARMPEVAPNPHHWVRVSAGRDLWESSGLANTVPSGDEGFWFDFDISNEDVFNFYVYWHEMRSGRCNDGSVTPGCEGDQGTTYHYGNMFRPPEQQPYPRDTWFCIEMRARANVPSQHTGELTFWIDDQLVGDYRPGYPNGTWLRDSFHTNGCTFSACTEPVPFEGFNFRTSADVGFKSVILDAYYERGSSMNKRTDLESKGLTVSDNQTIYYDDLVVATKRIGCRVP